MINEHAKGFFRPQRGLRQGDSLSPYLFLLYAKSLSHSLSSALSQRKIAGCQIAYWCPKISHLFFADAYLLFCKASVRECQVIQDILEKYDLASGQSVNFEKSIMLLSPCIYDGLKRAIGRVTGMKIVIHLGRYLGFPNPVPSLHKQEK